MLSAGRHASQHGARQYQWQIEAMGNSFHGVRLIEYVRLVASVAGGRGGVESPLSVMLCVTLIRGNAMSLTTVTDLPSGHSAGEWETRVALAATYRIINHYGMSDSAKQETGACGKSESAVRWTRNGS